MFLKTKSLPPNIYEVICNKATERPFCGMYDNFEEGGTYLCRQCGTALFRSQSKFHSGCGWPSFDSAIPGKVLSLPDQDNKRTEIVCKQCQGHLGHVFTGEKFTPLNTRHCVNSLSLDFVPTLDVEETEEAIFAAGCFWGVEALFKKLPGILKAEVGYTGGTKAYPTYEEVCRGNTGHYEAVRVIFDTQKINFEKVAQYFFEIHDPTQNNGQGPDLGPQYLSALFFFNEEQKNTAKHLIQQLLQKKFSVATHLLPATVFWAAENYHQDYYGKTKKAPYCHFYVKKF